jgi:hypothetical protein
MGAPAPGALPLWARQSQQLPPHPAPEGGAHRGVADEPRFAVRVMDNSINTYQEVIAACQGALRVSWDEAFAMAYCIDSVGSCVVCEAPWDDARRIAAAIAVIGIEVRIEPAGAAATPAH